MFVDAYTMTLKKKGFSSFRPFHVARRTTESIEQDPTE